MKKFSVLIAAILLSTGIHAQQLFKELTVLQLDNEYFSVNGTYFLTYVPGNSRSMSVYYPTSTPVDTLSVEVKNLTEDMPLQHHLAQNGIVFDCLFDRNDTLMINVNYRYRHTGNQAIYFFPFVRNNQKPLTEADYLLYIDPSVKVKSLSFPAENELQVGNRIRYHYQKTNFLPQKDFIIFFETEKTK